MGPALHPVPAAAPAQRRLVVVSNRMAGGAPGAQMSGGLAVGVEAALRAHGGIWFGWSGEIADEASPQPTLQHSGTVTYAKIPLKRQDYEEYYAGFANRVLWPLLHFRSDLIDFRREDFAGYLRVNRLFAAQLAPLLQPDDLVWVHDYHLMTLGHELRQLGAQQPTGFFLHTPFPPGALFRNLPVHKVLMAALCAFDLVGFQTEPDLDGFLSYFEREPDARLMGGGRLRAFGRECCAAAFPIGIDVDNVAANAAQSVGTRYRERLHESLRERKLMLGVDRLDYSKGLLNRFVAFERLFEQAPETRGRITFMQIAPPTRSDVPEYGHIRRTLEEKAGHINGRFSEFDWTPLRYLNKSFNRRTLMGFLRAANIGLVTPIRDGMNLVAKEYVAAQDPNDPGVLVLSSFAGAARELDAALQVNPYDVDAVAEAMHEAYAMPLDERRQRWSSMMSVLRRNDIAAWRETFVQALGEAALLRR
ncbi:MAG TPA: alpha,alpha-trehalose-phosphate synthase (UDP-forming) [Stellaceae bacterium]|nr:alpha,alpha-trehalose-phosphate synthase (UDP-forming) [Stellaceae bacterium]